MAVALTGVMPAAAQSSAARPSSPVDRLLACRTVATSADRLACFDRESEAVGNAIGRHDLTLIDRGEVERSRKAMFGFTSPDQRILARAAGRPATVPMKQDGVIRSVAPASYGHFIITLTDGAVWRNVDLLDSSPRVGAAVHIDRTPFGAYLLKMPNFISVHAVRVR